jgi:hypothetical protein
VSAAEVERRHREETNLRVRETCLREEQRQVEEERGLVVQFHRSVGPLLQNHKRVLHHQLRTEEERVEQHFAAELSRLEDSVRHGISSHHTHSSAHHQAPPTTAPPTSTGYTPLHPHTHLDRIHTGVHESAPPTADCPPELNKPTNTSFRVHAKHVRASSPFAGSVPQRAGGGGRGRGKGDREGGGMGGSGGGGGWGGGGRGGGGGDGDLHERRDQPLGWALFECTCGKGFGTEEASCPAALVLACLLYAQNLHEHTSPVPACRASPPPPPPHFIECHTIPTLDALSPTPMALTGPLSSTRECVPEPGCSSMASAARARQDADGDASLSKQARASACTHAPCPPQ